MAEDQALVRQGFRRILEEHPGLKVVGEAESGDKALEIVKNLSPDVVLLDIRMPGLNSIELVHKLAAVSPQTKILVLSAFDDDEYILAFMEAGVSGYILKTCQAEELVDSVIGVTQGKNILHPDIAAKVARLWARRGVMSQNSGGKNLSQRELEILKLAAKGLSAKQIANQVGLSVRTVNGHFTSIFSKLGVSSRVQAVLYAVSRGIATPEDDKQT